MAKYWVYLNGTVAGPYGVEELIRLRGFSRGTQVCLDDASGSPRDWISPAEIPELAHIFKAADDHLSSAPSSPPQKAAQNPAPLRPSTKQASPAVAYRRPARDSYSWLWLVIVAVVAGLGFLAWSLVSQRATEAQQKEAARGLIENRRLPPQSLYASLRDYLQEKNLHPRWEFERQQDGLYRVSVSWYTGSASTVLSFEANAQAQSVRGLNTAAGTFLAEGFPAPPPPPVKAAPPKKKSPAEVFREAVGERCLALEKGDFTAVWNSFSRRKISEMTKAGISREGFLRLQTLTFRVESAAKQAVVTMKEESEGTRLVLIKQSQPGMPEIYVKQLWVLEDGTWKMDDEQKRAAPAAAPPAGSPAVSAARLPGMSK